MTLPEYVQGMPAPKPLPLRPEQDVTSSWDTEGLPLVSVVCATYNHVDYLEDALRGFLGQETSFPFEIIVRDDASTDGTTELLLGYVARYPRIIRAVVEKENQHSRGVRANPALVQFARGEYVAICEGDDYWTAPDKLEKQVALLRSHPEATMCVARTVVCKQTGGQFVCETQLTGNDRDVQSFDDVKNTYFHTSTYLIRTEVYREVLRRYLGKIEFGDTALRYMLADIGPFVLLKEIVSVYRVTGGGIWTSLSRSSQVAWEIRMAEDFYRHFNPAYRQFFGKRLFRYYLWMFFRGVGTFNRRSAFANLVQFFSLSMRLGASYFFRLPLIRRLQK